MTQRHRIRLATLAAGMLPMIAAAHPGHGFEEASSFATGLLHPWSSADHVLGLLIAGVLAARLGGRYLWPTAAVLLGAFVAAWTADTDGWRFAAGFMISGAALVAAGVAATRLRLFFIAAGRRSPT